MTVRPPYIYQGGSVVMHPPMQLKQSEMYGYFVKGALAKLQASVDSTLNQVAGARMHFKVLSPYVMLTFTRVGHANSTVPIDKSKGSIDEIDIATWIMVGAMGTNGALSRMFWYPFHIFVDNVMALINGRELFGYPKYDCQYEMPLPGEDALRCALAVKGFQTFSEETLSAIHPLLEVNAKVTSNEHVHATDMLGLIEQAIKVSFAIPDFFNMDAAGWKDIASLVRTSRIDQIFLKQFPDSAGVKAVYQALLTAPAQIEALHSARLLGHQYECTLHALDSFPLDQTLGLKLGAQPAILPFHLKFDFAVSPGEELIDNSRIAPEKIAIIGGGVGSMTAAFYLSDQPGWQNKYDITVYQQGWRIGGKGASGRNAQVGQRIEEHGLHIWFGFYANAIGMMKAAYASLDRPEGTPLATWQDAFKPQTYMALSENIDGEWRNWSIEFPVLPGEPGTGEETITMWKMALSLIGWIEVWLKHVRHIQDIEPHRRHARAAHASDTLPAWLHRLADHVVAEVETLAHDISHAFKAMTVMMHALAANSRDHDPGHHGLLAHALSGIRHWVHAHHREAIANDEMRRALMALDLCITVLKGMLEDGVFKHGFDAINDIDLRAWLAKHGGDPELLLESAPVRAFYDLVFGYEGGHFDKPNLEAGTTLRAMMRVALCYKGGVMFKMQAGMGDTVFTPIYEILLKRGVKFKYFHRVEELIPDGDMVGEIRMTEQVALNDPDLGYHPLVDVNGLACWPSDPDYTQINPAQAEVLQEKNVNLESYWSDWPKLYQERFGAPLPQHTLKRGRDFDKVVFGISVGALPALCPQLLAASPRLKATSDNIKTVATQAYQVWLNQDLTQMGWKHQPRGEQPVLSGFVQPFDTWAPMDQLLCRETWAPALDPKNVSYCCSAFTVDDYPPVTHSDFPAACNARAKSAALEHLDQHMGKLWSNAGAPGAFPWHWLVDPKEASGVSRFDAQYWRANVDPSERYVMSVVGSTKYRLETDQSGFSNLYLTGDWIKTGLNMGCVEAAVMAGMHASRAITGHPAVIKGETDF